MQPAPKPNDTQPIHEQVIEDIKRRAEVGKQNYGTYLQANNGRDSLLDAYEEAQDKALYLKQAILERDALRAELARLQRNEDCVQRLIVWATENGWNGVNNSKILDSFIVGLFDELRAELAAHDAALLREVAGKLRNLQHDSGSFRMWEYRDDFAELIDAEADRIEKEAKNK